MDHLGNHKIASLEVIWEHLIQEREKSKISPLYPRTVSSMQYGQMQLSYGGHEAHKQEGPATAPSSEMLACKGESAG